MESSPGRELPHTVSAKITNEHEVEYESVNLGLVLAQMEGTPNSINIVILDAVSQTSFCSRLSFGFARARARRRSTELS